MFYDIETTLLGSKRIRWRFKRVLELLKDQGAEDVMVIGGGIIPEEDVPKLKKLGIKEIFLPGTSLDKIVGWVKDNVKLRC